MPDAIAGLRIAAEICRAREAAWRQYFDKAPPTGHSSASVHSRAFEAMSCADAIDDRVSKLLAENKNQTTS